MHCMNQEPEGQYPRKKTMKNVIDSGKLFLESSKLFALPIGLLLLIWYT